MYTILVTESNELITTQRERIMCRSKLVDKLHFLADPMYKGIDMSEFTVCLEYLSPASRTYRTEILTLSSELYKEKLEYILPFDTKLTQETGSIEVQLTFTNVVLMADGTSKQYVRKTSPTTIEILPIAAWSDIVPDGALTALDQRLLKTDAMIKALIDAASTMSDNKGDNLVYEDNKLILRSGDNDLSSVEIKECECDGSGSGTIGEEGVPIIEFGYTDSSEDTTPDVPDSPGITSPEEDDVVEF